jgi:hypothetical protein
VPSPNGSVKTSLSNTLREEQAKRLKLSAAIGRKTEMNIFDIFKTKWSAKHMTQHDRRKLFWYMKRKTSYTAWKAKADAFDRFATVFERQVKEQPFVARGGVDPTWGTNWETSYPEILKAQVLFEQGLARLLQGDRTVWLYNDRGVLGDADAIYGHWYTALVNHGPHGDIFFRGKYVDDLTAAILDVFPYAWATAGVIQQVWENPVYFEFWSKDHMAHLAQKVPFPPTLPDVPIPTKEVLVRTGEPAPCFGIFEAQVPDGCMSYLLEGVAVPPAVTINEKDGESYTRPATWRLIWEDTRYRDGTMPEEEKEYFPATEAAPTAQPVTVEADPLISLDTGQRASKPGIWVVANRLDVRKRFESGDKLPQHEGRDVVWLWVSKD